jgi:hypothetical protein
MSLIETYQVEEAGAGEPIRMRCRHCGHTWTVFDGKTWRGPHEVDHKPGGTPKPSDDDDAARLRR